jgi:type II secretory pathway component PulF
MLLFYIVVYFIIGVLPICGAIYGIYFLFTLPMRRNERARFFLDLLEMGLKEGRSPEASITSVAASQDRGLGVRFHLLAAHLEQGTRLGQALEEVPRLLPPQVRAMLRTGERIGDIARVLPACRQLLTDAVSQVRGALNYLILVAFAVTPFSLVLPIIVSVKVMPSFILVFNGMYDGVQLPAFTRLVLGGNRVFTGIQLCLLLFIWLALVFYVGGPRLRRWMDALLPGQSDRVALLLPWRRKRLQRDFSAMLAVLLDSDVSEAEAVTLAGEATANAIMIRRAGEICTLLKQGVKLPDAVSRISDSEELRWRVTNALQRGRGFLRALAGWHEALDARAFQLEQSAAQIATTSLVLINGCVVACIFIAIFLGIIALINTAILW